MDQLGDIINNTTAPEPYFYKILARPTKPEVLRMVAAHSLHRLHPVLLPLATV